MKILILEKDKERRRLKEERRRLEEEREEERRKQNLERIRRENAKKLIDDLRDLLK
jgi:hypothetical protein